MAEPKIDNNESKQHANDTNDNMEETKQKYNTDENKENTNLFQLENNTDLVVAQPSEIIVDELYLGDMNMAQNEEMLSKLYITHIVNVTMFENWFEGKIKYLNIKLYDSVNEPISKYFDQVITFIDIALNENYNSKNKIKNKVFVHCAQGVSRSATFVIAYCMKKYIWNFNDAFQFVLRKRPSINPNKGFIDALKEFEANQYEIKNNEVDDFKETKEKQKEREFIEEFCSKVKKYKCEDCDVVLINNFQMQQHMEQTNFEHCMFDEV
eukprot:540389_1